ncbi:MAG: ABC transporter permease, partial [Heyndrickxia sp.]
MGWFKRFRQQYSLFIVVLIICLFVWQWLVQSRKIPSFIIPTPTSIVQMMIHYPHELFVVHLGATFQEVIIGFLLALVGGVGIAIAMFFSKPMEKVMYPIVLISQTIPIIALSPIFIL